MDRVRDRVVHLVLDGRSFTEDYVTDLDALIAWGAAQPRTDETRASCSTATA